MFTTLAGAKGAGCLIPAARLAAVSQEALVEEHERRVAATKGKIKVELENAGHIADVDIKFVDGRYVGLFVLPSSNPNNLYVGFGSTGGGRAYNGDESTFDPKNAARLLVEHINRAASIE